MPNFDGGHYFLTMLAPVRIDRRRRGWARFSWRQTLLDTLAMLPNSQVGATTQDDEARSPFTRNTMTHLARFVLIDAPPYNGRVSGDSLLAKLRAGGPDGAAAGRQLGRRPICCSPPISTRRMARTPRCGPSPTRSGRRCGRELTRIFACCYGFEAGTITTAEAFFRYVKACQVETTFPFNDYWRPADLAKMPADLPLPTKALGVIGGHAQADPRGARHLAAVLPVRRGRPGQPIHQRGILGRPLGRAGGPARAAQRRRLRLLAIQRLQGQGAGVLPARRQAAGRAEVDLPAAALPGIRHREPGPAAGRIARRLRPLRPRARPGQRGGAEPAARHHPHATDQAVPPHRRTVTPATTEGAVA